MSLPKVLLVAAVLLAAALPARAEEALVLDNGAILQGHVVREDARVIEFRLSGVGTDSRVEVRKDRITKRFTTVDPTRGTPVLEETAPTPEPEVPTEPEPIGPTVEAEPLPAEEPAPSEERFFERFFRLAALAFPRDVPSRAFLAVLGVVVILCLVGLGARVADVEEMTLGKNTALALALAAGMAADVVWSETLLRADRAPWVIPAQLLVWVGLAAATLRCGVNRAVLLLAFVVFTGAIVAFAAGALLVIV
jgi:hypothetical protein